jgi:hypothetical protein
MKNKIFLFLFCIIFLSGIVFSENTYCYQNQANVSYGCGDIANPSGYSKFGFSGNSVSMVDGNILTWGTNGKRNAYLNITYSFNSSKNINYTDTKVIVIFFNNNIETYSVNEDMFNFNTNTTTIAMKGVGGFFYFDMTGLNATNNEYFILDGVHNYNSNYQVLEIYVNWSYIETSQVIIPPIVTPSTHKTNLINALNGLRDFFSVLGNFLTNFMTLFVVKVVILVLAIGFFVVIIYLASDLISNSMRPREPSS